ncbi:hypothetical protein G3T16_20215 [Kineobactrum salinum]|uniref:Transposase DDE domain-containing protein n=1 Tax=Kineobactrum salinum TaxID=2708301 RepID=A0A6C0U5D6_9GAMM|nr:hypothetical protein G3T16_20215 [Kineobactrum salinum]
MVGRFDGGRITSEGGGLLLREVDVRLSMLPRLVAYFTDHRNPNGVEHSESRNGGMGLALGYEDIDDHDPLRADSLLAALVSKRDMTGEYRERVRDQGYPLVVSSTLNRLELGTPGLAAGVV